MAINGVAVGRDRPDLDIDPEPSFKVAVLEGDVFNRSHCLDGVGGQ